MAGILPPRGLCNWCIHLMDYTTDFTFLQRTLTNRRMEADKGFFILPKSVRMRVRYCIGLKQSIIHFPFLLWFRFRCCVFRCIPEWQFLTVAWKQRLWRDWTYLGFGNNDEWKFENPLELSVVTVPIKTATNEITYLFKHVYKVLMYHGHL